MRSGFSAQLTGLLRRGRGLGTAGQLLRGKISVSGIDGLVDAGDDDGGVAGEFAGSVDGVAVPGAVGKARGREQRGFSLAEGEIQQTRSPYGAA